MDVSADLPNFAVSISQAMMSQQAIELAVVFAIASCMVGGLLSAHGEVVYKASVMLSFLYLYWQLRAAIWWVEAICGYLSVQHDKP